MPNPAHLWFAIRVSSGFMVTGQMASKTLRLALKMLSEPPMMDLKAKLTMLTGLAAVVLAGCESTQTGTQTIPPAPVEQTIPSPVKTVRSAATKTMSDRGYQATPAGKDTLLFDRMGDLGSTIGLDFLHGKETWRRVRMRLIPVGGSTRVTAQPALVTDRGTAFEREEADHGEKARQIMLAILKRIEVEAQSGR